MRIEPQKYFTIEACDLVSVATGYRDKGFRFVQCFANRIEDGFELTYSFDLDLAMENVRILLADGQGLDSISGIFGASFIFENEMHDLFGIPISGISVDFGGKFYGLSTPAPMASDTSAFE